MAPPHAADASRRPHDTARPYATAAPLILPGVEVVREGRVEPFLHAHPPLSSAAMRWAGIAVEDYSIPACVIPRHEHVESFLHVVGSPAGRLYGESLANALAVYLLNRYAVRRYAPVAYRGGLPGYRLRRVLDHIGDNLADDLSLAQLAAVAGMSPHYFAELFSKSMGHAPHRYVLLQRIERAKQGLCDPGRSVIEAGLDAGFQNPSHFARVFRKFVDTSPSRFRSEMQSGRR